MPSWLNFLFPSSADKQVGRQKVYFKTSISEKIYWVEWYWWVSINYTGSNQTFINCSSWWWTLRWWSTMHWTTSTPRTRRGSSRRTSRGSSPRWRRAMSPVSSVVFKSSRDQKRLERETENRRSIHTSDVSSEDWVEDSSDEDITQSKVVILNISVC